MMQRKAGMRALALVAVAGLAGCASQPMMSAGVGTGPSATMATIAANGQALGARTFLVGSNSAAVLYSGPPMDFIACADASGSAVSTRNLSLDARGEFTQAPGSSSVRTMTQYIVTMSSTQQSIEFTGTTSAQFSSGTRCSATGRFPGRLLTPPSG